jgi:hypothetical protein
VTERLYGSLDDAVIGMRIVSAASNALQLSRRVDPLPVSFNLAEGLDEHWQHGRITPRIFQDAEAVFGHRPTEMADILEEQQRQDDQRWMLLNGVTPEQMNQNQQMLDELQDRDRQREEEEREEEEREESASEPDTVAATVVYTSGEEMEEEEEEAREEVVVDWLITDADYDDTDDDDGASSAPRLPELPLAATSECSVCYENLPTILYMPCRHMRMCRACAESWRALAVAEGSPVHCPLCRAVVLSEVHCL